MRGRGHYAAVLLTLTTLRAEALDTEVSARVALWSSSQDLDDQTWQTPIQLWLRTTASHTYAGGSIRFHGEAWLEGQPRGDEDRLDGRVREAYVQWSTGPFEFRGGYQIFPWGRADAINPTDNLTPRKLTFLTRDTEDQRFGMPALRTTWFSGPVSMNVIWLTGFEHSDLPWPPSAPRLVHEAPPDKAGQAAARLEVVREEFEGSLSYFDGYDVLPTQALLASAGPPQALVLHQRLRIAGGDIVKTVGRYALRAELADMEPPATQKGAIFAKRPQWYAVAGGDRTFGEYFNVNLQYFYRHVEGVALPPDLSPTEELIGQAFAVTAQQYDRIDRGLTIRISDQWLNETVEASISGLWSLERRGYLVRPLVKYRATDTWTVSLGGDVFGGDDKSIYGFLRHETSYFLELRRGF